MKRYLTYIWLFVFSLLVQQVKGQNIQVDSLIITPQSPTKNDSVTIRLYTYTAFKGKKIDAFYSFQDSNINIVICYNLSGLAVPSYFADTFVLGKLAEGKYNVHYTGYFSADTITLQCSSG